jgi:hypothetical protein
MVTEGIHSHAAGMTFSILYGSWKCVCSMEPCCVHEKDAHHTVMLHRIQLD